MRLHFSRQILVSRALLFLAHFFRRISSPYHSRSLSSFRVVISRAKRKVPFHEQLLIGLISFVILFFHVCVFLLLLHNNIFYLFYTRWEKRHKGGKCMHNGMDGRGIEWGATRYRLMELR